MLGENEKYWAFISYSHQDKRWGDWLHKQLETYVIPKNLREADGENTNLPNRLFPVFRDREELPSSHDLGDKIDAALKQSRNLIVICSPRSASSQWVSQEVIQFKTMGKEDRVFCLIVDGEPNASDMPGLASEECFPEAIRFKVGQDGLLSEERAEPIAADARDNKDGKQNALLKLLAGVLEVDFDALKQRDQARRIRRLRYLAIATFALMAVLSFLSIGFYQAKQEADKQREVAQHNEKAAIMARNEALETQSQFLAGQAEQQAKEGNYDTAMLLALNAMPGLYGGDRPLVQTASYQLANSLFRNTKRAVYPHNGDVHDAQFSLDGKYVATASDDKTAKIWSIETGRPVAVFHHQRKATTVRFAPVSNMLVTISGKLVSVWSVNDRNAIYQMTHDSRVRDVIIDSSGRLLLSIAGSKAILWSLENGEQLQILKHEARISSADFHPDGNSVATSSWDKTTRIWDIESGQLQETLAHDDRVSDLAYSDDGKYMVTTSWDNSAVIWSIEQKRKVHTLQHSEKIEKAHFDPNGKYVMTVSGNQAYLWLASNGVKQHELKHDKRVYDAKFSPDGRWLVTGSDDANAVLWAIESGERVQTYIHKDSVLGVEFSSDSKHVLTTGLLQYATLWSAYPAGISSRIQVGANSRHAELSDDGELMVVGLENGSVQLWSVEENRLLKQFDHKVAVEHVEFSRDANGILSIAGNIVSVWSLDSSAEAFKLAHNAEVRRARYSPDEKIIVTVAGNSAYLWQASDGKKLSSLNHDDKLNDVVFSADNKTLITVSRDKTAKIWSVPAGKLVKQLKHENSVERVKISPDGKYLATASVNMGILWSVASGSRLHTLEHSSRVFDVQFSPDGRQLATASWDKTAALWSVLNAEKLHEFKYNDRVKYARFTPDGKQLLVSAWDKHSDIWSVDNGWRLYSFEHEASRFPVSISKNGNAMLTVQSNGAELLVRSTISRDIVKQAIELLPRNQTCLGFDDRAKFYLTALSEAKWRSRHCQDAASFAKK